MLEFLDWITFRENISSEQVNLDKALDVAKEKFNSELLQFLQDLGERDSEMKDALESPQEEPIQEPEAEPEEIAVNPSDSGTDGGDQSMG